MHESDVFVFMFINIYNRRFYVKIVFDENNYVLPFNLPIRKSIFYFIKAVFELSQRK